jgi:hypothetical protein
MRRALQSQSIPIDATRRGGSLPSHGAAVLDDLAGRFARFRQRHPRGTRVPVELRAAALAALQEGVGPGDLYRACGVSWGQVAAWKGRASSAKSGDAEPTDVRVFSVTDEPIRRPEPATAAGHELELRLGPWSVSVRLSDPGHAG